MEGKDVEDGSKDDAEIEPQRPVLAIFHVGGHAIVKIARVVDRTAVAADLGETGYAWFDSVPHWIVTTLQGKQGVVLQHVWAWSYD